MAELELIDRRALGIGKAKREIFDVPEYADGWNSAIEIIENAPTIEAKPVVHAHWIEQEYGDLDTCYTCSNCKEDWVTLEGTPSDNLWKYCPACGATMDEFASDNNVGSKVEEKNG